MCFMKYLNYSCSSPQGSRQHWHGNRIKGSTESSHSAADRRTLATLEPSARVTVTGGGTGCREPALLDQTIDTAGFRAIKFSEKMKVKLPEKTCRSATHRLRRPCRGSPLQPGETTDPPTTGRYLPGQNHQSGSKWAETNAKSCLLPRDLLRYLRVLQGKRTEKQEPI